MGDVDRAKMGQERDPITPLPPILEHAPSPVTGPEEAPERRNHGMPMDRACRVMRVLDVWEPGCSAADMRHVIRRLRAALTELEETIID